MSERQGTGYSVAQAVARAEQPDETSWSTTLSYERADRFREESAGLQAGGRFLVRDGERWLSWDAAWGTVSSDVEQQGGAPAPAYGFLLDPVGVVGEVRLEALGPARAGGSPVRAPRRPTR